MNYNKGDRIGDYEIVDVLGAGGMGRVYKVRNVISERLEAMKVLLPNLESDPDLADRFMREIKVQASLQHPNIACLHTALRINNQLLMLMEFVEGSTVEALLRQGPLPARQAVDAVRQVLLALGHAHQQGVVHRDIKPANIMVMADGTVKLMDFGIARLSADRRLTQTGRTVGSLYYMSPEQIQGAENLDARSDVYSLGVTLYEMVTARRPFQGDSDYSIMAAHLGAPPTPPIEIDPSLPAALNDIILMAIAKDPGQRFQTADAFRGALGAVAAPVPAPASMPTQVVSAGAPPVRPAAAVKNNRGLYMAIGSVATIVVLAVAAMQAPRFFRGSQAVSAVPAKPAPASPQSPVQPVEKTPAAVEHANPAPAAPPAITHRTDNPPKMIAQAPAPTSAVPVPASSSRAVTLAAESEAAEAQAEPVAQQQAPPARPAAAQPDLTSHREMMMLLGTRANSVKSSLNSMREQQARQGLNLRQDISTAEQRMEFYLDDAVEALRAADAARAKKSLESAERAIETIEKFLGR